MFDNLKEEFSAPGLFFTSVAMVLTGMTFIALSIMAFWALDSERPLAEVKGEFLEWSEHDPDIIWIQWSGIRNRACPGTVNRWLAKPEKHLVFPLPTTSLAYPDGLPLGEFDNLTPIEIPHHLDGSMLLRTRTDYSCNPLQRIVPYSVQMPDVLIPPRPQSNNNRPTVLPAPIHPRPQ